MSIEYCVLCNEYWDTVSLSRCPNSLLFLFYSIFYGFLQLVIHFLKRIQFIVIIVKLMVVNKSQFIGDSNLCL